MGMSEIMCANLFLMPKVFTAFSVVFYSYLGVGIKLG